MTRPDPGWLAHRLELEAGSLAEDLGVPLAPPPMVPTVDVTGYRPATSVVHKTMDGVTWHGPNPEDRCELCPKAGQA